jgi:hypothetical protein
MFMAAIAGDTIAAKNKANNIVIVIFFILSLQKNKRD